jgi:asparagine synthase (glutamine-hydrolysing)
MCGIGGVWDPRGIVDAARIARTFGDALAHRGPDAEGFLGVPTDDGAPRLLRRRDDIAAAGPLAGLLVHRRLSIIDLATGDQPMCLADGTTWIVYNGEIYNYPDLKHELSGTDELPFSTTSDTEVILRVYRQWGVEGFRRLNGIFAFALYDAVRRLVVLARDPIGVKPLYWSSSGRRLSFASEIRPLLESGSVDRRVSPDRLAQFLFYRFVPAPGTLWHNVEKVVPGHAVCFNRDSELVRDVDFVGPPLLRARPDTSLDDVTTSFVRAVQRQMLSDVPVGAFLSGGLDSSLVVAAMSARTPALPTFAIGFARGRNGASELDPAAESAMVLGTRHQGIEVRPETYFNRLPWAVAQVEEPLAHPGMLLQADLSAFARRQVKVVLTGQGADEPLGGYPRHHAARVLGLLSTFGGLARSRLLDRLVRGREQLARIRRVVAARSGLERAAAAFSPLSPEEAGGMVRGLGATTAQDLIHGGIAPWWNKSAGLDEIARFLYVDIRTSLADDLLLVGDKMSMAYGLEARVPYLDLEHLALVESIPGPSRVHLWGKRKQVQHAIGNRILPAALSRGIAMSSSPWRKKRGFDVPVADWFRNTLQRGLLEFLTGPGSLLPDYVDGNQVRARMQDYLESSGAGYRQPLAFFALELWLRLMVAGRSATEVGREMASAR